MERTRKTDLENDVVWYVSMKTYWDMKNEEHKIGKKVGKVMSQQKNAVFNFYFELHGKSVSLTIITWVAS